MSDTASTAPRVPKRVAAVILNSLKGGVVPRIGLPYITVGREVEIRALLTDLSLIADGGASFRFLVGRYGAGKSFLLQTIRTHAMGEASSSPMPTFRPSVACRAVRGRVWPPIASSSAIYRPRRAPRAARSTLSWIAGSPRAPIPTSQPLMPSLPRSRRWSTVLTLSACFVAIARPSLRATKRA